MYVLLHPATMSEFVEVHGELLDLYVRGEPGAKEVLVDALLELSLVSSPTWPEALKAHKKHPHLNLFWIGGVVIRQSIVRAGRREVRIYDGDRSAVIPGRSMRRGWQEIDATKSRHRELRKLRKKSA